jgi:hypothetical protein
MWGCSHGGSDSGNRGGVATELFCIGKTGRTDHHFCKGRNSSKESKELSDEDIVDLVDITEYDEVSVGVGKCGCKSLVLRK